MWKALGAFAVASGIVYAVAARDATAPPPEPAHLAPAPEPAYLARKKRRNPQKIDRYKDRWISGSQFMRLSYPACARAISRIGSFGDEITLLNCLVCADRNIANCNETDRLKMVCHECSSFWLTHRDVTMDLVLARQAVYDASKQIAQEAELCARSDLAHLHRNLSRSQFLTQTLIQVVPVVVLAHMIGSYLSESSPFVIQRVHPRFYSPKHLYIAWVKDTDGQWHGLRAEDVPPSLDHHWRIAPQKFKLVDAYQYVSVRHIILPTPYLNALEPNGYFPCYDDPISVSLSL